MHSALLELTNLRRAYPVAGEETIVLKDINLRICAGEMVAIVGPSGSGKSTLMNILGCMDRPSGGDYRVAGHATAALDSNQLAQLRREHFGFIFQSYHLLPDLSARDNVEMPAVYANMNEADRHARARSLLTRLGLSERMDYKPGQLSGGQQQRVSIARALMNGGQVILADEPTGALDRRNGQEVIGILKELHRAGHTVILVTHDMEVAAHAQRIIEIRDGSIVADRAPESAPGAMPIQRAAASPLAPIPSSWRAEWGRFVQACRISLYAMNAHRLRTFLTMLGIIIGIASVVSVIALGDGARRKILQQISAMGTNTIDIYAGGGFGDQRAALAQSLTPEDAAALAQQTFVDSVTPGISASGTVRFGNQSLNASITGVGEQYFRVRGLRLLAGTIFSPDGVRRLSQEAVIDATTRDKLFSSRDNPIGQVIWLDTTPVRVIGVVEKDPRGFGGQQLNIWLPYTTAMYRMRGTTRLDSITVRVNDNVPIPVAEAGVVKLLTLRHQRKDFFTYSTDKIRQSIEQSTATMALLVSMIALISLIVGGIGVMNIMLVSVTERTREIGLRMAVGARQSDIMKHFLIESTLVCLLGGVLGSGLALVLGAVFTYANVGFEMIFSGTSLLAAFACSSLIGMIFGYLPARNAARLDPVLALSRE